MEKQYFSYNEIHTTIQNLSKKVQESGFDPDIILAIGSGGLISGRILKTFLGKPLYVVSISYYDDLEDGTGVPKLKPLVQQWLDKPTEQLKGKKVLIVDEVDDTRKTLQVCCELVLAYEPAELGLLVLHNKLKEKVGRLPEKLHYYFAGLELPPHLWAVYPWEVEGCIKEHSTLADKMLTEN